MERFKIRKGELKDTLDFSNLVMQASGNFLLHLFGEDTQNLIQFLYKNPANVFSIDHTFVAEVNERCGGILLAYDYKTKKTEELNTGRLITKKLRVRFFKIFIRLIKAGNMSKIYKDDFYISDIAVYHELRGLGCATALIKEAEKIALAKKMRLSLDVESNNSNAIKLYRKLGFETTEEKVIKLGEEFRFLRMTKNT